MPLRLGLTNFSGIYFYYLATDNNTYNYFVT